MQFNKYYRLEKYIDGQPTGIYKAGGLVTSGDWDSATLCEIGAQQGDSERELYLLGTIVYSSNDKTGINEVQINNRGFYVGDMYYENATDKEIMIYGYEDTITSLRQFFYGKTASYMSCFTKLKFLSNFDTSEVTDMAGMFWNCDYLTELDVRYFNTEKVTEMTSMFRELISIKTLNLSNFNTEKVTRMARMFERCVSLTNLNISSFRTDSLIDMEYMFSGCKELTKIDISHFNVDKVTKIEGLFSSCNELKEVVLPNFNVNMLETYTKIFSLDSKLEKVTCYQSFKDFVKKTMTTSDFNKITWDIVD